MYNNVSYDKQKFIDLCLETADRLFDAVPSDVITITSITIWMYLLKCKNNVVDLKDIVKFCVEDQGIKVEEKIVRELVAHLRGTPFITDLFDPSVIVLNQRFIASTSTTDAELEEDPF